MSPIHISYKVWIYCREILFNVLLFAVLAFTIAFFIFPLNRIAVLLICAAGILMGVGIGMKNARKLVEKSLKSYEK